MPRIMSCVHCGDTVDVPEGYLQWDGQCACGRSVFDAVQDDEYDGVEAPEVGDMWSDEQGIGVLTPHGRWRLTDEQALGLVSGLSSLLQRRAAHPRVLRRPVGQTTELGLAGDYYS